MSVHEQFAEDLALHALNVLDAVAKEPRGVGAKSARGFNWWAAFGWAAAVGMLVVVIQLRRENSTLRDGMSQLGALLSNQTIELENAKSIAETLTAPDAMRVEL